MRVAVPGNDSIASQPLSHTQSASERGRTQIVNGNLSAEKLYGFLAIGSDLSSLDGSSRDFPRVSPPPVGP